VEIFAVRPAGFEASGGDEAIDLDEMRAARARAVPGAGGLVGEVKEFRAGEHPVELSEVVEKHGRIGAERARCGVVGEIAQQAVAQAAMGGGAKLLFDGIECVSGFAREFEAEGEDRGEPADGAREIGRGLAGEFGDECLLAAVAFEIKEQHWLAGPLGEDGRERGEERVIDSRLAR